VEEVLQMPEQRFPLQPNEKTMVRQAVPVQPMVKTMVKQIATCSPWRIPHQSTWMPEGGGAPVGSPHWSRLRARPVDPWREELTLEQVC